MNAVNRLQKNSWRLQTGCRRSHLFPRTIYLSDVLLLSETADDESASFLWSPIMDLAGQSLKTAHFWQPTAIATGHKVMISPRTEGSLVVSWICNDTLKKGSA
jgi:hypothetical protein